MDNKPIVLRTYSEDSKFPYFFQNDLIDKDIYIVQKVQSIAHALFVIDVWNTEKYNIGEVDRIIDPSKQSYTKYLYNNNLEIVKKNINGGDENVKILVYKKNGKINTCALLKFETSNNIVK